MSDKDFHDSSVFSDPGTRLEVSPQQLAARNKRNIAIAITLAAFMIFVFFSMLIRLGVI
jgi:hypothetical protein